MGTTATATRYASAERIGARVRALREEREMTTTDLAKKIGCSQQQVCAVELGRINTPVETLARIAEGLGVSLGALFVETPQTVPQELRHTVAQCKKKSHEALSVLHDLVKEFEKIAV